MSLDNRRSPHLGPVWDDLERAGFKVDVVNVEYDLIRAEDYAGNRMMRVQRRRVG